MPNVPILPVAGAKGGVGKTTTTLTLGYLLAERGYQTVVVDGDPQASATAWMHLDTVPDSQSPTALDPVQVADWSHGGRLLLARGGRVMERVSADEMARYLTRLAASSEVVLVDTVPALQPSVYAALELATCLLVPLQPEYLAARGLAEMLAALASVGSTARPRAIFTRYRPGLRLTRLVHAEIESGYPGLLCEARVPVDIRCAEAPGAGKPLPAFAPRARATTAYRALLDEIVPMLNLVPRRIEHVG